MQWESKDASTIQGQSTRSLSIPNKSWCSFFTRLYLLLNELCNQITASHQCSCGGHFCNERLAVDKLCVALPYGCENPWNRKHYCSCLTITMSGMSQEQTASHCDVTECSPGVRLPMSNRVWFNATSVWLTVNNGTCHGNTSHNSDVHAARSRF